MIVTRSEQLVHPSELQIRGDYCGLFIDNLFLFLSENECRDPSLELFWEDISDEDHSKWFYGKVSRLIFKLSMCWIDKQIYKHTDNTVPAFLCIFTVGQYL